MFRGDKTKFGAEQLAGIEKRKQSAHIRTPDEVADNLQKEVVAGGQQIYQTYCVTCHLINGKGDGSRFPPLDSSEYVVGNKNRLINILLNGLQQQINVNGKQFNGLMPSHSFLSDSDLAMVLTYIRQNFNNRSSSVTAEEVATARKILMAKK